MAPDEVVNKYFTQLYADSADLNYKSDLSDISETFFRPRGTVVTESGSIASGKFLGFPIVAGTIQMFLGENASALTVPVLSSIGLFFLYLFVRRQFNQKIALVALTASIVASSLWYWSSMFFFEDVVGVFLMLAGLHYSLRSRENFDLRGMSLALLFFGFAMLIKPYYAAIILPIVIVVLLYRDVSWKKRGVVFFPWILMLLVFMLSNQIAYGDFFTTGFHLKYDIGGEAVPGTVRSLDRILDNYLDYFIFILPASVLGIGGMVGYSLSDRRKRDRVRLLLVVAGLIILLTGYFFVINSATNPDSVHHSVIRYLIIVHLMMIPFAVYLAMKAWGLHGILSILIILALVLPGLGVVSSIDNISSTRSRYDHYNQISIERVGTENTVIICQYWDKVYFPDILTANPGFLPPENREHEVARISNELIEMDYQVFFMPDVPEQNSAINYTIFENELSSFNLEMEDFRGAFDFYQIVRNETC